MNKVGKFLKKLRCRVGGRVKQGNLVLSTELITYIGHRKEFKSLRFEREPLVRANGGIVEKMEPRYWWERGDEKTRIN